MGLATVCGRTGRGFAGEETAVVKSMKVSKLGIRFWPVSHSLSSGRRLALSGPLFPDLQNGVIGEVTMLPAFLKDCAEE